MKQYDDENEVEQHLIRHINRHTDLMAWHNLTAKEGYPDVTIIGPHIVLVEVKYDRTADGDLLTNIMEPSQPVMFHDMHTVGYKRGFLLVYHKHTLSLYDTEDMLRVTMGGYKIPALRCLVTATEMVTIADYLEHRSLNS